MLNLTKIHPLSVASLAVRKGRDNYVILHVMYNIAVEDQILLEQYFI